MKYVSYRLREINDFDLILILITYGSGSDIEKDKIKDFVCKNKTFLCYMSCKYYLHRWLRYTHCCGSGMFIPDLGSRIRFFLSRIKPDPGSSQIPDLGFGYFSIPDPGVKKVTDPVPGSATLQISFMCCDDSLMILSTFGFTSRDVRRLFPGSIMGPWLRP